MCASGIGSTNASVPGGIRASGRGIIGASTAGGIAESMATAASGMSAGPPQASSPPAQKNETISTVLDERRMQISTRARRSRKRDLNGGRLVSWADRPASTAAPAEPSPRSVRADSITRIDNSACLEET